MNSWKKRGRERNLDYIYVYINKYVFMFTYTDFFQLCLLREPTSNDTSNTEHNKHPDFGFQMPFSNKETRSPWRND